MNDASMPNASVTSLEHVRFPHLTTIEWEALHRLAAVSGDGVVTTLLTAGTEGQQRMAAQEFMARELADLCQRASTPTPAKNKTDIVKLDVSTYSGEGESKGAEPKSARGARYSALSLPALEAAGNPAAPLVREFIDIFPDKVPAELPPDRGVRHEIDLVPGAKYCVTRQWPLPRDQVEAIDAFFEGR